MKCILGHHIAKDNQSFTFKYSSCSRKLPFICTKSVYQNSENNSTNLDSRKADARSDTTTGALDRCHIYRREYPGGNWIECEKLVVATSQTARLSASRKCCLFDLRRRATFWSARTHCAKFNSLVYSFKNKGYKKILESYADYLSSNSNSDNDTTINETVGDFWTSCRLEKDDEIKCDSNERKSLDAWRSATSTSSQGPGLFLSYVLYKRDNKFRLNYLNISLLTHFNQSLPDGLFNSSWLWFIFSKS